MRFSPTFARPLSALTLVALLSGAWGVAAHGAPAAQARAVLLAGAQNGTVYRLADGRTWQEADAGLPSGADVTALALSGTGGGVAYAGTAGAGVFVSTDGGREWRDDNGGEPRLIGAQVGALAADPGTRGRVYAGTADGVLFRSDSGGQSWLPLALPTGSPITCLILIPQRPATLFVGTGSDGVLVSHDGGNTWAASAGSSLMGVQVNGLAGDPASPDVVYAATADGIYQTIDGGGSWQAERRGLPAGVDLSSVAVDPAHGTQVVTGGPDGRLYRSTDGGTSWLALPGALGRQINALLFDPARPGTVLVGAGGLVASYGGADQRAWDAPPIIRATLGQSVLCLAAVARSPLPTDPVAPPNGNLPSLRYFPQTGHLVNGPILQFYDRYGGLKIFGLPLSETFIEGGHIVQYFERARLDLDGSGVHPAPLGAWLTAGRAFPRVAPFPTVAGAVYFPATHHSLHGFFLAFWRNHHGSLVFGAPISEPFREQNGDGTGRTYLVQYFQSARMEYHPELSGTRYAVTLGQLGRQYLQRRGWL